VLAGTPIPAIMDYTRFIFWPERRDLTGLRVLHAGCGTGDTAVAIAAANRTIEVVGSLGQSFDYIVSCGVIHHLDNPARGVDALVDVLTPVGDRLNLFGSLLQELGAQELVFCEL
jgi:2-polyprenyl-3-methyl-5-hydroxy-6-metoxy-1,4-benzoquinol methylase